MRRMLPAVLCTLLLPTAWAGVPPLTLDDLCAHATRIVVGTVTGTSCRWEGTRIVTDVTVRPSENLKGAGLGPFQVRIPGGTLGGLTLHVSEAPTFSRGEQVVLFLRPGNVPCDVYGWFRGKYTVLDGRIREMKGITLEELRSSILRRLRK